MTSSSICVFDTDFLYGLFVAEGFHHEISKQILLTLRNTDIYISNFVKYELLTLISRRQSQSEALEILMQLESIDHKQFYFGEAEDVELLEEFKKYQSKKISIVDCSNLILARKLNAKIASFDKFYPSEILVQL